MSLSKCYAMGLRIAYLVAPNATAQRQLIDPVRRLSSWFPNSLCAEIVSSWAFSDSGRRVAQAVREEAMVRQEIAGQILDMSCVRTAPGALHLWLGLPPHWSPNAFAEAARGRGVLVRPADLFAVDASAVCDHVRVSLTGPASRDELRRGIALLASLLGDEWPDSRGRVNHDLR
jgi:DNA-binding transcriptional MocR family regulator